MTEKASEKEGTEKVPTTYEKFEDWLEKEADVKVRELYATHTSGLKSALEKEREEKKDLAKQLKDILPKAEKGSELEKSLTEKVLALENAEKRASFAEGAVRPEIGCTNIKAAWALANADGLFNRDGSPDWVELKKVAPELFRQSGKTDGGAGKNDKGSSMDMNSIIRRATGRV